MSDLPLLIPAMIHALHGNFGLPNDWDAALPQGVAAKTWHLWEIRRHHPATHSLSGFASWFNNQIAALPPDPGRLLAGYSLGGRLALHILADRPALWPKALLLSTHPGLLPADERALRLTHDATWQHRCLHTPWSEVIAVWNEQSIFKSTSAHPFPATLESWRGEIAGAFDGWSLGHQEELLSRLTNIPCSIQWLAGADDHKFANLAQHATASHPAFGLNLVVDSGHRLLLDQPVAVRSAIQAMLAAPLKKLNVQQP